MSRRGSRGRLIFNLPNLLGGRRSRRLQNLSPEINVPPFASGNNEGNVNRGRRVEELNVSFDDSNSTQYLDPPSLIEFSPVVRPRDPPPPPPSVTPPPPPSVSPSLHPFSPLVLLSPDPPNYQDRGVSPIYFEIDSGPPSPVLCSSVAQYSNSRMFPAGFSGQGLAGMGGGARQAAPRVPSACMDPGTFSGRPNESALNFMSHFEVVARANDWDFVLKCKYFPCFLRDAAQQWYNNCTRDGPFTSWVRLCDAFREHFNSQSYVEMAEAKLQMRLQGASERFESYFYDVLNLCDIIDPQMSEQQKTRHLLRGMKSDLVEKIYPMNIGDTAALLQVAISHEAARFVTAQRRLLSTLMEPGGGEFASVHFPPQGQGSSVGVATVATVGVDETAKILKELAEEVKALRLESERRKQSKGNYTYRNSGRTSDGKVICFRCNEVGHISRVCTRGPPQGGGSSQGSGSGNGQS